MMLVLRSVSQVLFSARCGLGPTKARLAVV